MRCITDRRSAPRNESFPFLFCAADAELLTSNSNAAVVLITFIVEASSVCESFRVVGNTMNP
jgi:hypothetical protein